ncbi:lysylphosphatidylglycerol synthase transmembrane domain-containing protein [Novosphingobium sp. YAF33]|uniref:lysylphosphatidylglycerol synthase transmembrane domain-containing protein n=1 Tax=Novosphingobium sp. YAF33 TaxID=3233082 RepID=UPI003F9E2C24
MLRGERGASTAGAPASAKHPGRRWGVFAFKLAISASLLVLLFRHVPFARGASLLLAADPFVVMAGGGLMFMQTGLSALKWHVLLRAQGVAVPYLKLVRTYFLANFINLFTPGFLGGDAYRSLSLRRYTGGIVKSLPSVIVDRITGLIVLIALAATGASLYLVPQHPLATVCLILVTGAAGYAVLLIVIDPLLQRIAGGSTHPLLTLLLDLLAALRPTSFLGKAFAVALIFQLNIVFIVCLWSAGLHLSATVSQLFLIVPTVYLLEILPISISGVGLREGTYAVLFSFFSLPPEQGLALGLLTSIMRYIVGAIGAFVWFIPDETGRNASSVPRAT